MSVLRALVVDDEAPARRRLRRLLEALPEVEVAGEAADGEEALTLAAALSPGVLFLDVRMPGLDGLQVAQRWLTLPPLVFCTAHDEFAVRAFEVNAVDYLLKPVRPERLAAAVEKVRARLGPSPAQLGTALAALAPRSTRVVSTARGLVRLFEARDVTRFSSADKYTVFQADGAEQLTEEPLSALEERLAGCGFLRIHRAELVRLDAVKSLSTAEGVHQVALADGQTARVSRRSLSALRAALGLG